MVESITNTLGTGSGIDVGALVTKLVDAQYAVKTKLLTTRAETLDAQISSAAQLKSGISAFSSALSSLVAPTTLAQLGIKTNRDGTLSIDQQQLNAALTKYPEVVERMFATGTGATNGGLAAALKSISNAVTSTVFGLGASEARYTRQQASIADDQLKATVSAEATRARLTKQFSGMDARVAAYRSTQAFIEQQVKVWTASA